MRNIRLVPLCAAFLSILTPGCLRERQFKIATHPSGATVFIEGEKRGQTDVEKLNVVFPKLTATLRVEKDGYQSEGMVLDFAKSPSEFFIVLHESPRNQELLEGMKRVQSLLEALPSRVSDQFEGREN